MRPKSAHNKQKRSRWPRFIVGIVLLFGLLFVVCYLNISASIFWNKDWRTTVVLQSDPLAVLSFPANETDQTLIITIPTNVHIKVPYGYGPYRISAVSRLGRLEKKPDLFAKALEDFLGVPVTAVLSQEQDLAIDANSDEQLLMDLKRSFSFTAALTGKLNDLHFFDRLLFVWKIQQLSPKAIAVVISERSPQLYINATLPDGTAIKLLDEQGLERFFEQKFEDTTARLDGLLVKVFNTTTAPGVGQKFARFITNFGGKVVSVDNFATTVANCTVTTSKEQRQKKLVRFLEKEIGCEVTESADQFEADVLVYVGEIFSRRWVSK